MEKNLKNQFPDSKLRRLDAFTIIELLVVIAIIALLAALLFPTLRKITERTRQATCLSNMRQLGVGIILYSADNNNRMPNVSGPYWDVASLGMLGKAESSPPEYSKLLLCPNDKYIRKNGFPRSYSMNAVLFNFGGSYGWSYWGVNLPAAGSGIVVTSITHPSKMVMLMEKHAANNIYGQGDWIAYTDIFDAHQGAMNVIYCDGSAGSVPLSLGSTAFQTNYMANQP